MLLFKLFHKNNDTDTDSSIPRPGGTRGQAHSWHTEIVWPIPGMRVVSLYSAEQPYTKLSRQNHPLFPVFAEPICAENGRLRMSIESPLPEFIQQVRSALAHLYDYAYLQNHPLALQLTVNQNLDAITRAQQVRRALLDAIEALKPQGQANAEATRAYAILTYHCVDGLTMPEITDKLALSRRQAYREYAKGVEAIASQLWDEICLQTDSSPTLNFALHPTGDRLATAQMEVERLRSNGAQQVLDPVALFEKVCQLLDPRLRQTCTRVTLAAPTTVPAIMADRTMLRQALLNVLSYALDMVMGQSEVQVAMTHDKSNLHIEIGGVVGLPTSSLMVPVKRQGVGLAVARTLIEAQGGALEIENVGGRWQAQIRLPLANTATILVVDDNEALATLYQRYLAGHQLTLVGTTTGSQALALAAELQPRLILLDLMLPQQDGWDILQALQNNPSTKPIPIIICSVLNEPELALALGASDYMTKPVSQGTLLTVLRRWLGNLHPAVRSS